MSENKSEKEKKEVIPRKKVVINAGDKINKLTVIADLGRRKSPTGVSRHYFKVKCECGKELEVRKDSLHGPKKMISCGCDHLTDVKVGDRYNLLTVVEDLGLIQKPGDSKKRHYFRCKCDCGGETIQASDKLISGATKTCGCLYTVRNISLLNQDVTIQLRRAKSLLRRTTDPRSIQFVGYGGRGIKCELGTNVVEVAESLAKIPGFFKGAQVDRIDNNGNYTLYHPEHGYEPYTYYDSKLDKYYQAMGNLRWVTNRENHANTINMISDINKVNDDMLLRPLSLTAFKMMIAKKASEKDYKCIKLTFIRKWYESIKIESTDYYLFAHKTTTNEKMNECADRIRNIFKDAVKKQKLSEGKSAAKSSSSENKSKTTMGVFWNEKHQLWVGFYKINDRVESATFDNYDDAYKWRKEQEEKFNDYSEGK